MLTLRKRLFSQSRLLTRTQHGVKLAHIVPAESPSLAPQSTGNGLYAVNIRFAA